ncbi:hypothetical protein C7M61_004451 [Candidozyma pseudohaemuli]|uniref:Uncharacterized protein n=1 Tax=Candidozyma pseudohaemuli TaxID=418784 RepID=A0A2P7YI74_9ASCO|nr:hypothetical protein C7M61_004451 [[Candida] pseudohaemulonii]PSK35662.1 hypothetical protein C7M61_004451 [[Candida] pseudohaemulonii]
MQLTNIAAAAAIAGVAAANNVTLTTHIVVTDYTTYCPEPTHVVFNNKTITVTEATTLTVKGPVTIPTTVVSQKPTPGVPAPETTAPHQHPSSSAPHQHPSSAAETTTKPGHSAPHSSVAGESTPGASHPSSAAHVSTIENNAGRVAAGAAAGLAAIAAALV